MYTVLQFAKAGDHNKAHPTSKTVDGITLTLAHRKNKLCAGPVPMWLKQIGCYTQGRAQAGQTVTHSEGTK